MIMRLVNYCGGVDSVGWVGIGSSVVVEDVLIVLYVKRMVS